MKEIWKDIPNYEGYYQVSNLGRVKSLKFNKERILPNSVISNGYIQVPFYFNCKIKRHLVHRLVAKAFIPNPNNFPEVNHLDGNKSNNLYSNLEWCNKSMNRQHAYDTGLQTSCKGSKHGCSKLTEEDIIEIRKLKNKLLLREIAEMYNVSIMTISLILRNKIWTHI